MMEPEEERCCYGGPVSECGKTHCAYRDQRKLDFERLTIQVRRATFAQLSSGFHGPEFFDQCEHCKAEASVSMQACRTAYADDRQNTGMVLCEACAKEYHDYWDEMWSYTRG